MSTLAFDLGTGLKKNIRINFSTASLKCGYAGATNPQFIPSIAGTPKFAQDAVTAISLGTEAYKKRAVMTLTNICSRGIVLNWDYFEQIYAHAFKALDVPNTEASTIMLTCPIKQSYGDVEKSSQIMFETFSVQAVGFEHQPVLSALANGFTTCAVVESGEGLTQLAVVQDGVLSKRAQQRLLIGGSDVSAYFAHLVQLLGYNLTGTSSDMILARDMKEKLCYVASDLYDELALFVKDTTNSMEKTYELPDGTMLSIGREMVYAPDIMFDPMSYDFEIEGVHSILHTMVQKVIQYFCNSQNNSTRICHKTCTRISFSVVEIPNLMDLPIVCKKKLLALPMSPFPFTLVAMTVKRQFGVVHRWLPPCHRPNFAPKMIMMKMVPISFAQWLSNKILSTKKRKKKMATNIWPAVIDVGTGTQKKIFDNYTM